MGREHRVIGPPGTGKTTYLSRQCLTAVGKYGAAGVAISSLTRAAAKEIASRSTGVPQQNIGTLHAHAYRQMDRPALAQDSKGVKDWNEKCGVASWRLSGRSVAHPEHGGSADLDGIGDGGDQLLAEVGILRARMVDPRLWPRRLGGFWTRWREWKKESARLDFTDLIEYALEHIDGLGVSVLMLDEAQDMSKLEMTLARKWGNAAEQLVICGDPDQNLYEWRGSDPGVFYEGEAASTRTLAQSYRVPASVHERAVAWIDQIPGRRPVEYRPTELAGAVRQHDGMCLKDGASIVRLAETLSRDGSTVMILGSCNYMMGPICAAMKEAAVPFHNPYRIENGAWNPMNSAKRLLAFLRPARDAWGDQARNWTWDEVRLWTEPLVAKGVLERGMKAWIAGKSMGGKFDTEEDRLIESLMDVLKCFERDHWDSIVAMRIDWWTRHLKHQDQQKQKYPAALTLRHGPAILREQPKIIIGTIHSVKGGEADKVILSPDLSRAGIEEWMSPQRKNPIVRMFYVGMTRARQELHLLAASTPDHITW